MPHDNSNIFMRSSLRRNRTVLSESDEREMLIRKIVAATSTNDDRLIAVTKQAAASVDIQTLRDVEAWLNNPASDRWVEAFIEAHRDQVIDDEMKRILSTAANYANLPEA